MPRARDIYIIMQIEQRQTRRTVIALSVTEFLTVLTLAAFGLGMIIAQLKTLL